MKIRHCFSWNETGVPEIWPWHPKNLFTATSGCWEQPSTKSLVLALGTLGRWSTSKGRKVGKLEVEGETSSLPSWKSFWIFLGDAISQLIGFHRNISDASRIAAEALERLSLHWSGSEAKRIVQFTWDFASAGHGCLVGHVGLHFEGSKSGFFAEMDEGGFAKVNLPDATQS